MVQLTAEKENTIKSYFSNVSGSLRIILSLIGVMQLLLNYCYCYIIASICFKPAQSNVVVLCMFSPMSKGQQQYSTVQTLQKQITSVITEVCADDRDYVKVISFFRIFFFLSVYDSATRQPLTSGYLRLIKFLSRHVFA